MANDIKDIAAPTQNLGDVMLRLSEDTNDGGLDRVRGVLAMRMNQYSDIALTKDEVAGIARSFHNIETGSATNLVMMCSKEKCLYKTRCVLYTNNKCPVGRECLHENYMLTHYMHQYLESLEVDINNAPEMVLINQLVEYELIEYRCNSILSHSHTDLTWTTVIGVDKQGEIVEQTDISYAFTVKERVQKLKFQLLQEFTATRKEKYKKQAALKEAKEGPSKIMSSLKAGLINKKKQAQIEANDVKEQLDNSLRDPDMEMSH